MTTPTLAAATPVPEGPLADRFVQPLIDQLGFHHFAFHRNLEGITHEESLRAPGAGGNCLNWVVGHLVIVRQNWLTAVLDEAPLFDQATLTIYRRGSSPLVDGTLAMHLDELTAAFDRGQAPLVAGLSRLTAERLASPAPFSPRQDPGETVGSLVAGLTFHEAYHVGQTAILRRLIGHGGAIA